MDSNHSSTLFSRRMNPSRTENRLYPAAAFVNGGSLSDSLCMGMFQARMYWHQKEDIEISERKALDLLQSYWHQLLLRSHMAEINLFSLLSLLRKHAKKGRRKGEETASDIVTKLEIW